LWTQLTEVELILFNRLFGNFLLILM